MIISILEKVFWSGVVGFGFAFLFNVPYRLLFTIFIASLIAGFIKFGALAMGLNIILSSLLAASFVGIVSVFLSRIKQTSPFVISIPSVIGMIPGYFGYKTLLGIMHFALGHNQEIETGILLSITHNAINMMFVLGSLSIGVSLPWLLFRKKDIEKIKFSHTEDLL